MQVPPQDFSYNDTKYKSDKKQRTSNWYVKQQQMKQ